jgi:serine/threonine-protein kinase
MMNNNDLLNNRYRLLAQQGSGGMAVIYRAQDLELGRIVAIKILRPSLTSDQSFLARFKNEARSVANLQQQNIVTVYDFIMNEKTPFIVMEFVDGQDLKKIIKTDAPLSVDRALSLAIQICAGIGYAHRAGLVHADVKPQNILLTKEDVVKVTDFGIAQALSNAQPGERQSVVWGSPHYFAPEQAKGERPTAASDVYSIGIVMFEMLTGKTPYTGKDQRELALAHIQERVPMVTEQNANVPQSLAQIIYKTMSKDPTQRYRMADQLGNVLASYKDREKSGSSAPAPIYTPPPPAQQMPTWVNTQPPSAQIPSQPLQQQRATDQVSTQRVDLAPQAPGFSGYPMPPVQPVPQPYRQGQTNLQSGYSQGYSAPYRPPEFDQPRSSAFDLPTIVLSILAFLAVACLIPLYIAVFQARF